MPLEENGWMLAGDDRVCPSPVSLQTSTSCRLGTDQMWLQDILQGSLLMQEEQPPLLSANATLRIAATFLTTG